nr:MAG TPA: hypothetical protein [Bacteriophage sp.]
MQKTVASIRRRPGNAYNHLILKFGTNLRTYILRTSIRMIDSKLLKVGRQTSATGTDQ